MQAAEALLADMRREKLADSTIVTAEFRLWHVLQIAKHGERPIRWLKNRGAELYEAAQVNRSADTHHAELALAKQVGELAVKRKWLRANPFSDVEPVGRKKHGRTKKRLRVDESRKLWGWCLTNHKEQGAVITLAYLVLGARASELVKRNVRDLDDDGRLLWIEETKTDAGTRRLSVPDPLRGMLLELVRGRAQTAPIFVNLEGNRASRYVARHSVMATCRAAGVPVLPPQALRRTHSDLATDAGVAGEAVARHLGHTSTTVTDRSYRDRQVTSDARQARAFRVIAGGQR